MNQSIDLSMIAKRVCVSYDFADAVLHIGLSGVVMLIGIALTLCITAHYCLYL